MNLSEPNKTVLKVFLVDDSELIIDWVSDKIDKLVDIELVGFSSFVEGTSNKLLLTKPDVVILDMKLPDGNGIEIIKSIKEYQLLTKIVVFTMHNSFEKQCRKAGCDYFFDKSGDFEGLINILILMSYNLRSNNDRN